ncbi:MAG: twitch domain-containing radical SAM protein [Bacteroidetes bacterium]|nr:twitch domain-containing radical SAM protein [Bacteroidota bacterium]
MIDLFEAIKTNWQADRRYAESVQKGYHPLDKKLYKKYNQFRPDGAKPVFCYLPFSSMTFSFNGAVHVCGYNRDVFLGRYPENTIDQIWQGEQARKLREHMMHNDLDYGCRHCKFFFEKEKFSNLRPLVFDKYYQNTDAVFPTVFEFELSNECNLECQMCSGEVSSSIRKNRDKLPPLPTPYDDAFVEQLTAYIPHLREAKFYGGEPFLIPIYYKIWDKVKELNPGLELFTITNGTHWNSKIERLVTELNFDLAVSIDAYDKEKVERIRKNVVYEKLIDNIHRFSRICTDKGKHLSLSFTVQKDNWEQLPLVINLCNEVNAFIYVSYLERPIRFSIAELPQDELKKIREYMEKVSLPRLSSKERHNYKCFEDFKNYLDRYISNESEKRYHDYEFSTHAPPPPADKEEKRAPVNPQIYLREQDELLQYIEEQYQGKARGSERLEKSALLTKMEDALADFTEEEKKILRGYMMQTKFEMVAESMASLSVENLKKQCRVSLQIS